MINFKNTKFIKSASKREECPKELMKEIIICGKSNVGKSSLINSLCNNKNLAFTSSKPGHTKLLNYYNVDNKFYLVDAPGYGYAKGGIDLDRLFVEMMESFFKDTSRLKCGILLLDSRRKFSQDELDIVDLFNENNIPYILVLTKTDKINQSEKYKIKKEVESQNLNPQEVIYYSIYDKNSSTKINIAIENIIK